MSILAPAVLLTVVVAVHCPANGGFERQWSSNIVIGITANPQGLLDDNNYGRVPTGRGWGKMARQWSTTLIGNSKRAWRDTVAKAEMGPSLHLQTSP